MNYLPAPASLGRPRLWRRCEDRGDIQGVGNCALECKCAARIDLAGWMAEARREAENAGLPRFAVVAKRRGIADVAESYASVPLWLLAELLREGS